MSVVGECDGEETALFVAVGVISIWLRWKSLAGDDVDVGGAAVVSGEADGVCVSAGGDKASPSRLVGGSASVPATEVESSDGSWLTQVSRKGGGGGGDVPEVVVRSRSDGPDVPSPVLVAAFESKTGLSVVVD